MTVSGYDYEPGDVNTINPGSASGDEGGAEYEPGDVNTRGSAASGDDMAGNRNDGGTPEAVLVYLARSLANDPDAVVVQVERRQESVRLRLHVAPEDMGRVIGRRGRTAQAIRTLVGVAGAHDGVQTSVDIVDE